MIRSAFLVAAIWSVSGAAVSTYAANLSDAHTVYLLPMASGLDQFLAVSLTTSAVIQVVTDPQKADAIFTDHLGEGFEARLDALYGSQKKTEVTTNDKADAKSAETQTFSRVQGAPRGRGAAFLVDRKTREVIWSIYDKPKDSSPDAMKRSADRIVGKLAKAVKPK